MDVGAQWVRVVMSCRLGLWFSFEFVVFLCCYGFCLGLYFSFGFIDFRGVYGFALCLHLGLSFGSVLFSCSFGSGYTVIWKRTGELRSKVQGGVVAGK